MRKSENQFNADVDALFRLPLAEFTGARNALAAQLKKSGRSDEALLVKTLAKPPISAWTVNQLYWNHRSAFDQLLASGERFHKAQTSGKVADMREALDERREALTHLSDLATSLLGDAGNKPSLETIRRITTTLEAMSVYASRSDAPRPGRLTHDVDPPGFEAHAAFVPTTKQMASGRRQVAGKPARSTRSPKSDTEAEKARPKQDKHRPEETRRSKIAAAKASLQEARRSLAEARTSAQSLEAAQKKAEAEAKKAEKQRRDVEQELREAKAASEEAAQHARSVTRDVEEAARAVKDAERVVKETSKELESLFRE